MATPSLRSSMVILPEFFAAYSILKPSRCPNLAADATPQPGQAGAIEAAANPLQRRERVNPRQFELAPLDAGIRLYTQRGHNLRKPVRWPSEAVALGWRFSTASEGHRTKPQFVTACSIAVSDHVPTGHATPTSSGRTGEGAGTGLQNLDGSATQW